MVKVWAEKEMRNYRRIHAAGIPCPAPVFLKSHVLLMEFLGSDGWPSPRLKDAGLSHRHMREAYVQTILIMRHLFQRCKLVHGDLSEYNLLWHKQEVYVIDVSQSVESSHPSALDFLRKDASNVNDYFSKIGKLDVMTTRQLFEFIVAPIDGGDEEEMECLERQMLAVEDAYEKLSLKSDRQRREHTQQVSVDEAVFMSSFLPRSLNQVADYDIQKLENGEAEESYACAVAALTGNKVIIDTKQIFAAANDDDDDADIRKASESIVELDEIGSSRNEIQSDESNDEKSDCSSNEDDETDDSNEDSYMKVAKTAEQLDAEKAERRATRKANKKAVKEAKIERRKEKIKKKDKKRAIKKTKAGNRKIK